MSDEEFKITPEVAERVSGQFDRVADYGARIVAFLNAMLEQHRDTEQEDEERILITIAVFAAGEVVTAELPEDVRTLVQSAAKDTAGLVTQTPLKEASTTN